MEEITEVLRNLITRNQEQGKLITPLTNAVNNLTNTTTGYHHDVYTQMDMSDRKRNNKTDQTPQKEDKITNQTNLQTPKTKDTKGKGKAKEPNDGPQPPPAAPAALAPPTLSGLNTIHKKGERTGPAPIRKRLIMINRNRAKRSEKTYLVHLRDDINHHLIAAISPYLLQRLNIQWNTRDNLFLMTVFDSPQKI